MATCGNCPYWHNPSGMRSPGECRRHTPSARAWSGQPSVVRFPRTDPHDWCGEHPGRKVIPDRDDEASLGGEGELCDECRPVDTRGDPV